MPRQLHALPTGIRQTLVESGGWGSAIRLAGADYPARTSIASLPQMRATSAQNSLSGRTLAVTSRITEKSRGFSRRRRTSVSPGFLANSSCSADARPLRSLRSPALNGDQRRQVHARDFQRHDVLHGNFRAARFLPAAPGRAPGRLCLRCSDGLQALILRGKNHRLRWRLPDPPSASRPTASPRLLRLRWMPVRMPHSATSVFFASPSRLELVCVASSLHLVHDIDPEDGR